MKKVDQSALLPYPAEFMFNLVNNVADYSDFLPWCETSEVLSQTEDEVVARLTMAGAGLRQGFTARNRLTPPHQI
ncbi:MAG: type II toxin-antitoxin system RatA family toxin, partial [Pseudomonadales bacterium]